MGASTGKPRPLHGSLAGSQSQGLALRSSARTGSRRGRPCWEFARRCVSLYCRFGQGTGGGSPGPRWARCGPIRPIRGWQERPPGPAGLGPCAGERRTVQNPHSLPEILNPTGIFRILPLRITHPAPLQLSAIGGSPTPVRILLGSPRSGAIPLSPGPCPARSPEAPQGPLPAHGPGRPVAISRCFTEPSRSSLTQALTSGPWTGTFCGGSLPARPPKRTNRNPIR